MRKFLNYKKIMKEKLIKIKCNLTNKVYSFYESYYNQKITQYGSEENLKKFYIQNKIISFIKKGHDITSLGELFGFDVDKNNEEYYKELITYHRKNLIQYNVNENITFIETDPEVTNLIKNWINYNNGN